MGFMNFINSITRAGEVNSSDFPLGTYINFGNDEGEASMIFTLPNKQQIVITHDMVKCATVLAMGIIDIKEERNTTVSIYGTKYLCILKDGRQAVLTVGLGKTQYRVERVLF